jgi:hypothetical protein
MNYNQAVINAASEGDLERLKKALKQCQPFIMYSKIALQSACFENRFEIVKYLISIGVNPDDELSRLNCEFHDNFEILNYLKCETRKQKLNRLKNG